MGGKDALVWPRKWPRLPWRCSKKRASTTPSTRWKCGRRHQPVQGKGPEASRAVEGGHDRPACRPTVQQDRTRRSRGAGRHEEGCGLAVGREGCPAVHGPLQEKADNRPAALGYDDFSTTAARETPAGGSTP